MDLEYFKDHICEELSGAKEYAMNAIEIKPMSATWGSKLLEMSAQELAHAKNLFGMWQEYYGIQTKDRMNNIPDCFIDANEEITRMYVEESAKIQYMHQVYK